MKKNGFTLIELLAVVVVLAAIALITTATVSSIMADAKKSSFESSVKGVYRAIQEDYTSEGFTTAQKYIIHDTYFVNDTSSSKYQVTFNGSIKEASGTANASFNETTGNLVINMKVKGKTYCANNATNSGRNEFVIVKGNC